ncbi:hypothetical protein MIR68_010513 [Amoeboaphelidium protococcarum]|nr:hypothetical protein MIR68_010513 [Amoeboaphelidium protococcarum]KAI3642482.1 hypothetical protein MP228_012037 [Amoeboaphelidium protococcarum]KAI3645682.1 hypothetical protein MP228_008610 [Amoeboaphelidium protococcarum]
MDPAEIERRVLAGERPQLTDDIMMRRQIDPVIAGLCDLMEMCWAQDPLARPPIDQVVRELERLEEILRMQPDADVPFPDPPQKQNQSMGPTQGMSNPQL